MTIDMLIGFLPNILGALAINILVAVIIVGLITYIKLKTGKKNLSIWGILGKAIAIGTIIYLISNIVLIGISLYMGNVGTPSAMKIGSMLSLGVKYITILGIIPTVAYISIKDSILKQGESTEFAKSFSNSVLVLSLILLFIVKWIMNIMDI